MPCLLTSISKNLTSITQTHLSASQFWDFSLAYYKYSDSAELMLELQNSHNLDVNLILFSLWIGSCHGSRLEQTHFHILDNAIEGWRANITQPLRNIRQSCKHLGDLDATTRNSFTKMAANIEIRSEHACQAILTRQFFNLENIKNISDPSIAASKNLNAYFAYSGTTKTGKILNIRNRLVELTREYLSQHAAYSLQHP